MDSRDSKFSNVWVGGYNSESETLHYIVYKQNCKLLIWKKKVSNSPNLYFNAGTVSATSNVKHLKSSF